MSGIKALESPDSSVRHGEQQAKNYYDPNLARHVHEVEDLHIECPSNTTERKLIARIDGRVIPWLTLMYLLAFLDRTNIANASIFGLQKDLKLTGTEYNTALTIFFIPYIILEIPSNILLKKVGPNIWLSACMFLFGLVTICQGLVHNYSGLLATRFFLGVAESGMLPACFYIVGMWYKRSEAQRRYSFLFSSVSLAGAFGGLLASAIGTMDGLRGYRGWRWIFILEGTLTSVVALIILFLLPVFPEDARWLTEEERAYVKARLRKDQGRSAAERRIEMKDVVNVFRDYKVFIAGFMYFGLIVPAYGYAYFAPSIIRSYGYSPIQTQLHSVPPWAAAFAFAMLVAYVSDKTKHRFLFTMIPIAVVIAGFAILITVHHNHRLEYGALFLVAMGSFSAMPVIVCWFTMNLGGHHRRSVGTAWQVSFGNIGGIIATYAFLAKDAPRYYKPGYSICIAFVCLSAASCVCYLIAVWTQNRNRDRAAKDLGLTEFEKTEKGDMSPDYRYLL